MLCKDFISFSSFCAEAKGVLSELESITRELGGISLEKHIAGVNIEKPGLAIEPCGTPNRTFK